MAGLSEMQPQAGALEAVERIIETETEPDEVLRRAVAALHEHVPGYARVALYFVDEDELLLGPWSGDCPAGAARLGEGAPGTRVSASIGTGSEPSIDLPVVYRGQAIALLAVDGDGGEPLGEADRALLERVAELISAHCLVGWDTGGVPWSDVS